jgi:GMP synthase-like glutamine amidotransferase
MTRIAIVETGRPPEALRPEYGDYADMFDRMLGDAFLTLRFDAAQGALPDPSAFDGAIITGSAAGVYEDHAWLPPLFDWIRSAKGEMRLLGVCFGHQAMAQALGGRVEKSDKGWGVGLHRYDVVSAEPWMRPPAASVALPASHQDQVVVRPPEARVILSSDFAPLAGLAWGDDAVSMQPHPEFSPEFAAALTAGRRDRMDFDVVEQALFSLTDQNDRALVGGWVRRFLSA